MKQRTRFIVAMPAAGLGLLLGLLYCATPDIRPIDQALPFREIWGYLMAGEEKEYRPAMPITDIGYFAASPGPDGRLRGAADHRAIPLDPHGGVRVHLVIFTIEKPALLHTCLLPGSRERGNLVRDIVSRAPAFDGIQIDFESIAPRDREPYLGFIRELRDRLPPAVRLSVAIPARRTAVNDAYDYAILGRTADRVVIMAYDEHWSTSPPGPVASLAWCNAVASFAVSRIPAERLVMGMPLYGRAWQDRQFNRALRFKQVEDLMQDRRLEPRNHRDRGPSLEYLEQVRVTVYFEDTASLVRKMQQYRSRGVSNVSFWRIGQGPAALWEQLYPDPEFH